MRLLTVAGPPSSGKTSVILQMAKSLDGWRVGVVKFDCLVSFDRELYEACGIPCTVGFSGKLCPDHYFVTNIQKAVEWGQRNGFDLLVTESAGLCNRCSPHIRTVPAVCVVDNLAGINTPRKLGPMLRFADIVVVTKGDIVSQAEREVFAQNVRLMNTKSRIIQMNGITGQGAFLLARYARQAAEVENLAGLQLRFTTPSAICSYCTGEKMIGLQYQLGMTKEMVFEDL